MNHAQFWGGAAAAPYEIEQSLRFDGTSGKLTRTNPASSGITNAYKWSYSFWLKHSDVSSAATITQPLLSGGNTSGGGRSYFGWGYTNAGRFWLGNYNGSDYVPNIDSVSRRWRDASAWEHFLVVYDTSESVNTDRLKFFSNGIRWEPDSFVNTIGSTQLIYAVNYASKASNIGYDNILNTYFDGYMAEVHFVDGQALDQYDFGEFDDNGVWRPIEYTGTYGLNGHYLKFDPSATNGVGHDHSGNGNNFTASGFTTTGTGTDVMSDTPTKNWCTWNPLDSKRGDGSYNYPSDGNLYTRVNSAGNYSSYATNIGFLTSGKWYFEYVPVRGGNNNSSNPMHKLTTKDFVDSSSDPTGLNMNCGTQDGDGGTYMVAIDMDNGYVYRGRNGTWSNSGDPTSGSSGTGNVASFTVGTPYRLTISHRYDTGTSAATHNFGQRAFAYTVPTGYSTLNTSNLPAPDIADGSENFNTVLWTGNGSSSTRAITGVGFNPDLTWIKGRSYSGSGHRLMDRVRGDGIMLQTNSPNAEFDDTPNVPYFSTDGFTLATTGTSYNASSNTYVAWNWLEGASQGFDIISYTGNGVNGRSIAHSLGVTPAFIIVKNRDSAESWAVWHQSLDSAIKYLVLNNTAAAASASAIFGGGANEQLPDSTNFYIGSNGMVNANGDDYIAYCFAEVEGYSKFGSYTGNGSTDGPFVYCGFRPAFILIKGSGHVSNWRIMDDQREGYNPSNDYLRPNVTDAEASSNFDILSNGFKLRNTDGEANSSNNTFIFAAFASNPFGGDGVSPATAR